MKKIILGILVGAIIGFGIYLNNKENSLNSNPVQKLRLGSFSNAVDYAPYLIAKQKGWFEEEFKNDHIEVEYTLFQSLPPINEAFATNNIDVVFAAEIPAIVGNAAGIDTKIIGISSSLVQQILVHISSDIKNTPDLKGKKIAVLAGTSAHYGIIKNLSEHNISKNEVEIIDMTPPDAKNAFTMNKIDAWSVWPPFPEQEQIAGEGRVLPNWDGYIQSVIIARGGFLNDNPETAKRVLNVIEKTKSWMKNNPEEAKQLVANEIGILKAVVDLAWGKHNWDAKIDDAFKKDVGKKADFLRDMGYIKNTIDVNGMVDAQYAK